MGEPIHRARRRTVALLIESSRAYARGVLRGIARFAHAHGQWAILHQEWTLNDPAPPWLKKGVCDGVIAQVETRALFRSLRKLGIPIVDVRGLHASFRIPAVGTDDRATALMAADHLLSRGFREIGFCGLAGVEYSEHRRDHFVSYMQGKGRQPLVYEGIAAPRHLTTSDKESNAQMHEAELSAWVRSLPLPIGIMACNDIRGRQLLSACRTVKRNVPDQIAVIGVDNDEVLCDLAEPPLSSVIPATDQIGYEAATKLNNLMEGIAVPPEETRFAPIGIVTRLSSDVLAVKDPLVAEAVRYIRQHASDGINVDDVLNHLGRVDATMTSRSTLNRRFTEFLGRSPKQEIIRVRMERVSRLLRETDYTLAQIAPMVGLEHAEHLLTLFKKTMGMKPGEFRSRVGGQKGEE